MSNISYAAVARNTTILTQNAITSGNFDQWTLDILGHINQEQNQIMAEKGNYRFFIVHEKEGLNFVCAANQTIQAKQAFDFLDQVKKRFNLQYARSWKNAPSFGMQQEFGSQLNALLTNANNDKIRQIKSNISDAQASMTEAMQNALLRGDKIEDMSQKADIMAANAKEYERSATKVKRKMCWEKYRWYFIGAALLIIFIFILVLIICGGFTFHKCKSSPSPSPSK